MGLAILSVSVVVTGLAPPGLHVFSLVAFLTTVFLLLLTRLLVPVAAAVNTVVLFPIVAAGATRTGARLADKDGVVVQGVPPGTDGPARIALADRDDLPHPQQRSGGVAAHDPLEHQRVARRPGMCGAFMVACQHGHRLALNRGILIMVGCVLVDDREHASLVNEGRATDLEVERRGVVGAVPHLVDPQFGDV